MRITERVIFILCLQALSPLASAGASEIAFSTFLGGFRPDSGSAVAVSPDGGVVIVGQAISRDFPVVRPLQSQRSGAVDAFIVKLDAEGQFEFSTFLGGSSNDSATDVAVDKDGNIYVVGGTISDDFPIVGGDVVAGGDDDPGFLAKISPDGQEILFSTLLEHGATAIALESGTRAFVTGNVFEGPNTWDVFVVHIDTATGEVLSDWRLGGTSHEFVAHLEWDSKRRALWLAGETYSRDFPLLRPLRLSSGRVRSARRNGGTGSLGFLARFALVNDSLILKSSSLLSDAVEAMVIDRKGRPHLATPSWNETDGWEDFAGICDYSLYFRIQASGRQIQNFQCLPTAVAGLATDRKGRIVLAGRSRPDMRQVNSLQAEPGDEPGYDDLYLAILAKGASRVLFGSYFGGRASERLGPRGLAVSRSGKTVFLTGVTRSIDFPLVEAAQPFKLGRSNRVPDAFASAIRPYK